MSSNFTESPVRYKSLAFFGYPKYRVGDDGSVWSIYSGVWKKLQPCRINNQGHLIVNLFRNKQMRTFLVHRLVLMAFVGPCPEGMEACHYPDRNPGNNRLENLRWDTYANNNADKLVHGTAKLGESSHYAKLTDDEVREIRVLYATGKYTMRQLAEAFGVSTPNICLIVNRVNWKHI